MTFLLSTIAIIISFSAVFINQWVTFIPQLGIEFQYHKRRVQIGIALFALLLTTGTYISQPTTGQLLVLVFVVILTPLSGFNHAGKALVPVDYPKHVEAKASGWHDETRVIGCAPNAHTACAWSLDTLISHHLVNDIIEDVPVLSAW